MRKESSIFLFTTINLPIFSVISKNDRQADNYYELECEMNDWSHFQVEFVLKHYVYLK